MADLYATLFPATFPALALAHFLALLSPGPDFFCIVGHAVRLRLRGSAFICLGIALGNAAYILLVVAGWAGLREIPALYRAVELAGGCYLGWLGFQLLKSSRSGRQIRLEGEEGPPPDRAAQLAKGLGSALLNPKNAIFYLTLMTGILGAEATLVQQAAAGVWMVSVVLIWDLCLAAGIAHPRIQKALTRKIPLIEGLAGLVLLVLAAGMVRAALLNQ